MSAPEPPESNRDWERLLSAERHVQHLMPGTVLLGGTAFAARHRMSAEGDRVLEDLRRRFDQVLADLETEAGWPAARIERPMDGILTGIRQQRRTRPLETEVVAGLRVPTLAEMARVKSWLLATRHTVGDYLDTVVLFDRLGDAGVRSAMAPFDEIYRQSTGASPLAEVGERLAAAAPADRAEVDLSSYRGLKPPWTDWTYLAERGTHWAMVLAELALGGGR